MQNPSLLELLFKIINNALKHFKLVSAIVLVPTIIVFVLVMWVIDPVYSSRAVVSPPNSNNSLGKLSGLMGDRKSTRLNSSHVRISYAVFCLKKKNKIILSLY